MRRISGHQSVGRSSTMSMDATISAETVIAALRAHQEELRKSGIRHLWLFGSVARGDATAESDLDLAAELDPDARIGLLRRVSLVRRLGELLGLKVDLITEPIER